MNHSSAKAVFDERKSDPFKAPAITKAVLQVGIDRFLKKSEKSAHVMTGHFLGSFLRTPIKF